MSKKLREKNLSENFLMSKKCEEMSSKIKRNNFDCHKKFRKSRNFRGKIQNVSKLLKK